jgi:spore coat protein A, manganese oxidase
LAGVLRTEIMGSMATPQEPPRRAILRWGLTGALGIILPACSAALASMRPRTNRPVAPAPSRDPMAGLFRTPLPVPSVLRPVSTDGGADRYEITQSVGKQQFRPGVDTEIWGYDGAFPGPTIVARRGRPVIVRHTNNLPAPTVVHLHGGIVPADADGYPVDVLLPAGAPPDAVLAEHAKHGVAGIATGSRDYRYPNDQPAATLWYHDHRMGFTGPQVYRGLAGFYLLRDDAEDNLPLPRGDRDVPLMIADRTFTADGSLFYPWQDPTQRTQGVTVQYHHSGMIGDTITVNGAAWPVLEVKAALYRLRFLNASNARVYQLVLEPAPAGGSPFVQIGSDAGLLPKPVRYDTFAISPGERYDMLVDFSRYLPGTRVLLKNTLGDGSAGYVMLFEVTEQVRDDARVPDVLGPVPAPPPRTEGTADRRFSFMIGPEGVRGPPMVNFETFSVSRIDARPVFGATEIWDLNADPTHPVHLHGAHFRILTRNGRPPEPQDAGWKDTVFLPTGGMRVAVTFSGHRGRYLFHCHNLEHGDAGMMANLDIQ